MSLHGNNRTLWTEGMFLGPHHFQQHDRFLLGVIAALHRCAGAYRYGLLELDIDRPALTEGKFALASIAGIFSDGTPFSLPDEDSLPAPLEVDADTRDRVVSIGIARSEQTDKEVGEAPTRDSLARYLMHDRTVGDRHSPDSHSEETVFTGGLWTRLVLESDEQTAFHTIPVARIRERRADGSLVLDDAFFPCALSLAASEGLFTLCRELASLATHRARDIAGKLGTPTAGDSSLFTQFLLLQTLNRTAPLLAHIGASRDAHPESLYRDLVQLAGELATLTRDDRLAGQFVEYRHRDQYQTFKPLFDVLRASLDWIPESTVESVPVRHVKAGIWTATVADRNRFDSARFILAVKAGVTPEELARRFPRQTTIASKTRLRELVEAQSRGIELQSLVTVPNSIPTYEQHVYFEMQPDSTLWKEIAMSGDIALHIAGSYSDLQMQIWTLAR